MTNRSKDTLLRVGKTLARILQGLCAIAAVGFLLLIPLAILASLDALPDSTGLNDLPLFEAAALPVVGIGILIVASLAALFLFFGKMRAIITSAGEGDPFIPENAERLNAMAWLLLAYEVAAVLVGFLRLRAANLVDGTDRGPGALDFSIYDLEGPFLILVLFILARIFKIGAAMRRDLEGTV